LLKNQIHNTATVRDCPRLFVSAALAVTAVSAALAYILYNCRTRGQSPLTIPLKRTTPRVMGCVWLSITTGRFFSRARPEEAAIQKSMAGIASTGLVFLKWGVS
jgi:hypothetical protein